MLREYVRDLIWIFAKIVQYYDYNSLKIIKSIKTEEELIGLYIKFKPLLTERNKTEPDRYFRDLYNELIFGVTTIIRRRNLKHILKLKKKQ